mgnify:CR=1 FL=1
MTEERIYEGRIKWFNIKIGYGFIERDEGDDMFIHINQWRGPLGSEPREGERVAFEVGPGRKGKLEAKNVRSAGTEPVKPVEETWRKVAPARPGGYHFLNPYNFVRPLSQSRPEGNILGNCPPPPHDRYVDGLLTGRITCSVTAVTPLFISDSHAVKGKVGEHRSFRFFEYDGEPAIPASSLRGMIRSVFETVTNSCFAVFEGQRLSYRLEARRATALVPARVEKRQDGTWHLHLLTGFVPLNPGRRPKGLYAATVHLYDPIQGRRIRTPKINLDGFKHGDPCHALVEKKGIFTYVLQLGHTRGELESPRGSQRIVSGWLCINNQNVENKRKERFFFRIPENTVGPTHIPLRPSVREKYGDLIADYQTRHEDAVEARRKAGQPLDKPVGHGRQAEPALSRYMYSDGKLKEGTLVYAGLSGTAKRLQVEYIAPAAVPRVSYNHSVAELLSSSHLHPCDEHKALCPACRVFGWVYQAEPDEKISPEKVVAYAGRLRFSHATLCEDEDKGTLGNITLAILSSPKPTTTRFYLRPKGGRPRDGRDDADVGYDGDNILRGRKVYRHHGKANPTEYKRATTDRFDGKDNQNRTVRGTRKPGNKFQFTIDFHNLAPVELGALLWALELRESDRQGYHRLGFAKPLGFGSVKLEVTALRLMDPVTRYESLEADGGWRDVQVQKMIWIDDFRQAMETLYGRPFAALPNVSDLLALLGEPPPDLPIHYPRVDQQSSPEGKNFEWFMGNKRSGRDAGPRLALPLADEDTEGLPLLDKYGRVRNA